MIFLAVNDGSDRKTAVSARMWVVYADARSMNSAASRPMNESMPFFTASMTPAASGVPAESSPYASQALAHLCRASLVLSASRFFSPASMACTNAVARLRPRTSLPTLSAISTSLFCEGVSRPDLFRMSLYGRTMKLYGMTGAASVAPSNTFMSSYDEWIIFILNSRVGLDIRSVLPSTQSSCAFTAASIFLLSSRSSFSRTL
mmetsp:Transcript_53914/g.161332  ORF Transcript_53914/g.161332 Transcript_53914/m.161332 type:complete len:203 (-) Transcript_53914:5809-6417(-)